jgi:cell division septal protein FtsQ
MPGKKTSRRRQSATPAVRTRRQRSYRTSVGVGPVRVQREVLRGTGWHLQKWPAFLLIGLVVGLLYVAMTFDSFYVYAADIQGASLLNPDEVYNAAGVEGFNVFWLDEQAIAARVLHQMPYVTDARVRLQLPNQVHLAITERRPRIAWETSQGRAWVDDQGIALPPLPKSPPEQLVHLVDSQQAAMVAQPNDQPPAIGPGGVPVVKMQPDVVQALLSLETLLPGTQTFNYDAQSGLNFRTVDGASVIFGMKGDLARKVAVLQAIQRQWKDFGRTPTLIDLRVADRPFVR